MRALQVDRVGVGTGGLELRSVPAPQPGPDEVLVAVSTVAANHLDRAVMAGHGIGRSVTLPRTLGIDPSGLVLAQGVAVSRELVGRRVVAKPNVFCGTCRYCRAGREADCTAQWVLGVHRNGGAADRVVVPARAVLPIPDGMTDAMATAAVHSVPVALHLLAALGELGAARVLVTGARGAVGSAAVQLARLRGATVTALVRGSTSVVEGASAVVEVAALPDLPAFDAVVDTTGDGAVFRAAVAALDWCGRAVTCAGGSAPVLELDLAQLYRRRLSVLGAAAANLAEVREGLDLVAAGTVRIGRPVLVGLEGYRAAYAAGPRSGKVVFEVEAQ